MKNVSKPKKLFLLVCAFFFIIFQNSYVRHNSRKIIFFSFISDDEIGSVASIPARSSIDDALVVEAFKPIDESKKKIIARRLTMSGPSTYGVANHTEFKETPKATQLKIAKNVPLDVKGRKRLATGSILNENFVGKQSKSTSVVKTSNKPKWCFD